MNRSLALKLLLSFLVVGLAGTAVLAALAATATRGEFAQFMLGLRRDSLADELASYYAENQSWEGVPAPFSGRGAFLPRRMRAPGSAPVPYVLVDGQGNVIVSAPGFPLGGVVSAETLNESIPIHVGGQEVGRLVTQPGAFSADPAEAAFVNRINQLLGLGALVGTGAAVVLGAILVRSLTRPLKELTEGARAVAAGQLETQVPVRSSDEMGELAKAFNQMNANLMRARDLRRQMTADIAHELRTPLSIILGHSEGIREGVLQPSSENLEIIHDEAARLERLVEDLRTLSLVEAGELPLDLAQIQPADLLRTVAARYRAAAEQKGVGLEAKPAENLPPIHADGDRLVQVLGNLVSNALRHTPENGQITLSADSRDGALQIRIADTGPGIAAGDLPHIFERFYRADKSRQREGAGSGLGLAIARSLVEAHGGEIRAQSADSSGTTMLVELPLASQY